MKNIAIFASGSGTNAENIIRHFQESPQARVCIVLCDQPGAYVLERARRLGVPTAVFSGRDLKESPAGDSREHPVLGPLLAHRIDLIILAGFLRKIPEYLLARWPERILNIHPALLPAYGGKGMYGEHVHRAVVQAGEKESGITVHVIDSRYDCGETLFQAKCRLCPTETPESLAAKIHRLEQAWFPLIVEGFIRERMNETGNTPEPVPAPSKPHTTTQDMKTGLTHTSRCRVTEELTARTLGSGDMDVLATPAMIALMENAAMLAVAPELESGSATVGTLMQTSHLKASPLGAEITATAELISAEGRKLTFKVTAADEKGIIGEGTHERFIVNREKFLSRL